MRLLIATLAVAAVLGGCAHRPASQEAAPVTVTTAAAQKRVFSTASEISGTVVASRTVTVGANAAGRLSSVPIRVGDRVQTGQVLATIDPSAYSAALSQASGARAAAIASVAEAQAGLVQAQARERLAEANERRSAVLYSSGDVSGQNYDEAVSALATARASVAQAQAAVTAASGAVSQSAAALEAAKVPLANTIIRAPFDGVITQKLADSGAVVNPGASIVTMEDARTLEAEVAVPEGLIASAQPGTAVRVRVDALGATIDGRVRAVIPSSDAQLHTATVRVALPVYGGLLRGMFVRVRIAGRAHEAIAVPWQAVITRAGQSGVFAVKDGRASFLPVESGSTANRWVAVRGVPEGALVVLSGVERLDDGTKVASR